ncbi:MAG: hypothetical protein GY943_33535, partial [Chloroflexi bacterium]|nr:hypothetical protein [Chloroflexota bacterium]
APLLGGALFQAINSTAPFIVWGVMMGGLWILAVQYIRPGREETAVTGLARGGTAH